MADRPILWRPTDDRRQRAQLFAFMTQIARKHGISADWETLYAWSIAEFRTFWREVLAFAAIEPSAPANDTTRGDGMLGTEWFPGMRLNYARHLLRFSGSQEAIRFESESGATRCLSRDDLRAAVARCAAGLRNAGVTRGDRVAGYLPNIPETIVAMLATASLGAVWSSCSPDFGVRGVLDRFGQIEPRVLFTADSYSYGGTRYDLRERVAEIAGQLPSLAALVVIPYLDDPVAVAERQQSASHERCREHTWGDFIAGATAPAALTFEEVPFDHPLFIMYSSGTTGVPKGIVHGHGGTLLQHMKELMLHCDLREGERIFYFTTCGWMMWNWLVSGLGVGATVLLFDGNPGFPTIQHLWDMAARNKVNVFGTSPKFLAACDKSHIEPGRDHDLSALRCVLSTGSPLSEELFEWVYRAIKPDLQLSSISGGTDILSCFMLGNPLLPVRSGEIQCRGLGMDVQAWDENRHPVIGQKGELVCCTPFPSQPVGFWNDPDGAKYRKAYFEHYSAALASDPDQVEPPTSLQSKIENRKLKIPVVWRHGDYIEITPAGGVVVYGRSDATLNPGGVRIGTAEIYRLVEGIPEIVDSIVVGRDTPDEDVEVCLFVVLRAGLTLSTELARRTRDSIAAGATKRHVPKHIRQVAAIPYTVSGKKVELAVQQVLHGQEVKNRDALANPSALEEYRGILEK